MSNNIYIRRTLNRTFYYGFSSILGSIVGFLMLPIYTNYLTPADYGVASFLILYVSLAQALLGAKLEQAISKFHYDESVAYSLSSIWATGVTLTTCVSIIPLSFGLLMSSALSNVLFGTEEHSLAVAIISLNILFGTLEIYGLHYIKIVDMPRVFLLFNVLKLLTQLSINVWLVVILKIGVLGVVISSAVAAILMTIVTFSLFAYREKAVKIEKKLIRPLFVYSLPLWISGLVGLYTGSIHQVFINYSSGLSDLGLYNLANTFGALVAALALGPFFSYWQVERFRIYERKDALEIYARVFYGIAFLSLFLCFGIATFSGPVIQLMANESFHPAIDAVAPLCVLNVLMYLGWYLNFSFLITNSNREIAINGFIYALVITLIYSFAIPIWGFRGAAYGIMIGNLINFVIISVRAKKYYDMNLSVTYVLLMVACSLGLTFVLKHINSTIHSPFGEIIVSMMFIAGGCILCAVFAYLFKPREVRELLELLRNSIGRT